VEAAREATGWELVLAPEIRVTEPPTERELEALRELLAR
jgi:glutaconate CoA-transferase subunit B